jgi:sec-independent protein translocase protein TatA
MNFLGIGSVELLVVLGVALIVFGPNRLPELARYIAKAMKMFRDASNELQRQLDMSDWDKPSSKTSSYTSDETYGDSDNNSDPEYDHDPYNTGNEDTDAPDSSSSDDSGTGENQDEYGYSSEEEAYSSNDAGESTDANQKPIDDPDKVEDAQRFVREMND